MTLRALPIALLWTACGAASPAPERPEGSAADPVTYAVALRFEDAGTDDDDNPRTAVSLVRIAPDGTRDVAELSEEVGACYHEPAVETLIAARCWWGATGARYEVRREGDAVVAYRAAIVEERGTGDAAEAGRLEVDPEAELEILTPGRRATLP